MTEPIRRRCEVCNTPMEEELSDYYVDVDEEQITIEDVPTWVCPQCGNTYVEDDVVEAVEDMLDHLYAVAEDDDQEEAEEAD